MKRHQLDAFSLVFGLAFAGLGALLLDTDVDVADLSGAGWIALPLVLLGVFLLAVGVDRARSKPNEIGEPEAERPPEADA